VVGQVQVLPRNYLNDFVQKTLPVASSFPT
jgi:hypothetical protein